MPKGLFTQCAVVLMEHAPAMAQIVNVLQAFPQVGVRANPAPGWMGAAESLLLPYRPEVNGALIVDALDSPWPDGMEAANPDLFGAWSMGFMGPFAFPGGLQRAVQQAWGWPQAAEAVNRHHAFLRIRSSYTLGAGDDAPVLPDDYAAYPELQRVTEVAQALLTLPGALCHFNPNGETLHPAEALRESLAFSATHDLPPLDVWSNVRMFNVENGGWLLMDTVGMAQLDVDDHEACFRTRTFEPGEVANFLRNATAYILKNGPVIQDGDTMNGPGRTNWQARVCETSMVPPPRRTLRWFPQDGSKPPVGMQP